DAVLDVSHLPVRPHDPPLGAKSLPGLERAGEFLRDAPAIVRVNAIEEALERADVLPGLHSIDVEQLVRPRRGIALEVADPASDIGEPLRFREVHALLLELGLGPLAPIDLLLEGG